MNKHTPGPWKLGKLPTPIYGSDGSLIDQKTLVYSSLSAYPIANVGGLRDKNEIANDRLIASAPDLLEACKMAIKEIEVMAAMLGNDFETCLSFDVLKQAIEKAEGRPE